MLSKNIFLPVLCFFTIICGSVAQCPTFTNADLNSSDCFAGVTTCDLCVGDDFTLTAEGSGFLDGSCIDWYYSSDASFDPNAGGGNFMGCANVTTDDPCNACLTFEAILVHGHPGSSGNGVDNEFIIFNSGGGFDVDDFYLDFDASNNGSFVSDEDIGAATACPLTIPTTTLTGCASATPLGPGDYIPPNALVVVFTDIALSFNYDFSSLCATGANIYYMQSSCDRMFGAFSDNSGGNNRTQSVQNLGCGCISEISYTTTFPSDGDYILGDLSTGNAGSSSPPVSWTPGSPLTSTIDPFTFTIDASFCGGGPYFVKGIPNPSVSGCPDEVTATLEFNVLCPMADITGINTICEGESTELTATGGTSYSWSTGGTADVETVTPPNSTTVTVTVTEGNCEDDETISITVLQKVPLDLGTATFCESDGVFNLSTLTDPSFNDGVWSGTGVSDPFFDPTGLGGQTIFVEFDPDDECGATTQTTLEIGATGFLDLTTDTVCQSSAAYNLDLLTDPNFPDGDWNGQGVSSNFFDPTGLSGLITVFFEPDDPCAVPNSTEIFVLLGNQPMLGADTICQNSGNYDLTQLIDPAAPNGAWSGAGVTGNTFDPSAQSSNVPLTFTPTGGCSSAANTFILVTPSTTPTLMTDTICQSGGTYDLTQLQDANFSSGNWFGTGVIGTQLSINNATGAVPLRFDPTTLCALDANTQIVIFEPITFDSLELTCDSLNASYQVSFEVLTGDSANISITGGGGTLTGDIFLSDTLMPGDTFLYEIHDGGKCPVIQLKGEHDCGCSSFAGAMIPSADTLVFCESEMAIALSDSTFFFDGNDTVMYVLHTSDSTLLGTIVGANGLPQFGYDPSTMSFGTTYFISTVVGSRDSLGMVSLADSCLSVAAGIPIQFTNTPQSFWVNEPAICQGEPGILQLALSGIAPFSYEIFENGIPYLNATTSNGLVVVNVSPNVTSVYSINAFSDSNCPGSILDTFVTVRVVPPMSLTFVDTIFYGNGTYSVVLDIAGGDSTNYDFVGGSGSWDGDIWTSAPLPCGTSTNLCVSGGICAQVCYSDSFDCSSPCTTFAGTMLSDTLHLCLDQQAQFSNLNPITDADDVLKFYLHTVPGAGLGTVLGIYDVPEFDYFSGLSTETVYYFSAVVGTDDGGGNPDLNDNCLSVAPGTPVIFHEFPIATFGNDLEVCSGDDVAIDLNFSGNAPFNFNYEINNIAQTPGNSTATNTTVNNIFNQNGQVVLTQVNDQYCSADFTDTIEVSFFPDILIQNLEVKCDSITQTAVVSFSIAGGAPGTFQVIAGVGILTGNDFTGFPLPSGDTYNYLVFDGNRCDTIPVSGPVNCSCATNAGTIQPFPTTQLVCGNEEVFVVHNGDEVLDNDDILRFVLHDSPTGLGNILDINDSGRFRYSPSLTYGTTYYISAIAGSELSSGDFDFNDQCANTTQGNPVVFQPSPTANFSIGNDICEGDSTTLNFTFNGIPSFEIFYDIIIGGVRTTDSLTTNANSILTNYTPPLGATQVVFEPIRVESNGCISASAGSQTLDINLAQINRIDRTLCTGDSLIINGLTYNQANPTDTVLFSRQAQNGCDSLVYIDLKFGAAASSLLDTMICENDTLLVNNEVYDMLNPTGQEIFSLGSCDSIVDIQLAFFAPISFGLRDTFCLSDTLIINGTIYDQFNQSGIEILQASNTCDSTLQIDLFFKNQLTGVYRDTICPDSVLIIAGERFDRLTPSGQVLLQTTSGCDSLLTIELEFELPTPGVYRDTLCSDGFYEIGGERFDETRPAGQATIPSIGGCDSLVNVALEFRIIADGMYRDTLCAGGFYEIGGERFDETRPAGQATIQAVSGCDSLVNVALVFRQTVEASLSGGGVICAGDSMNIQFNLSNIPSVDFEVRSDRGETISFTNQGAGFEFKVAPTETTSYEIFALDANLNNCPANITGGAVLVEVSVLEFDLQVSDYQGFNVSCFDSNNGTIDVSITAGTMPLTVRWSDGNTDFNRTGLASGSYAYEVADAAGCVDSATIILTAPEEILPQVFADSPSCIEGQKGVISMESVLGGSPPFTFSFDGGMAMPASGFPIEFIDLDAGVYQLEIIDANGCQKVEAPEIFPATLPMVELGRDTIINLGDQIQLIGNASINPTTIIWNPTADLSCDTCLITLAAPTQTTTFQLTIADAVGCSATDSITIQVVNESEVFVPEAFSPNDDGINDGLTVFSNSKAEVIQKFYVFDRWGNTLFEGLDLPLNDPSLGWDGTYKGKRMNPGVYVYFAEVKFADGTTKIFKGDVTLM